MEILGHARGVQELKHLTDWDQLSLCHETSPVRLSGRFEGIQVHRNRWPVNG